MVDSSHVHWDHLAHIFQVIWGLGAKRHDSPLAGPLEKTPSMRATPSRCWTGKEQGGGLACPSGNGISCSLSHEIRHAQPRSFYPCPIRRCRKRVIDNEFPDNWRLISLDRGGGVTLGCSARRGLSNLRAGGTEMIGSDHRTGRISDGLEWGHLIWDPVWSPSCHHF